MVHAIIDGQAGFDVYKTAMAGLGERKDFHVQILAFRCVSVSIVTLFSSAFRTPAYSGGNAGYNR